MGLKQVIEVYELLDSARVKGEDVARLLKGRGVDEVEVVPVRGQKGATDSIKVWIPGVTGRRSGAARLPSGSSDGSEALGQGRR